MPPAVNSPSQRTGSLTGLAAIRAFGCVLIVLAHAAIPYMIDPPLSIEWPVHEPGSRFCDLLYLWCRASQCGFFILSGMMAAAALRHDLRGFVRSRLHLLGRTLLIATFTVLPAVYLVWMLGWWRTGYIQFGQLVEFRLSTDDKRSLLGFAHLWYLEYLLIYSLLYAAWRWVRKAPLVRTVSGARFLVFTAIVALWGAAWATYDPEMLLDFRNGFVPSLPYLAYNGAYFALGVMLWGARARVPQRPVFWLTLMAVAQGVFVLWASLNPMGSVEPSTTLTAVAFSLLNSLAFTALALVSRWDTGAAYAPVRTLVRSAYFTYLTHLPIVGAVNIAMWSTPLPSAIKFFTSAAAGLALPLLLHRMINRRASAAGDLDEPASLAHSSPAR
jgi:hypothetical protein